MEGETSLSPYSKEQITGGEKLPEKISSIGFDVETGEKLKLDFVLERLADVTKEIQEKTKNRFVLTGSMGMYATLNELRSNGQQLMLLEQRISGGKNDYDIGMRPNELQETMVNFGWNEESKKLERGKIGDGGQMIDIMSRKELTHFPWYQAEVGGQKILVQTPEEMIFEKMSALIKPGVEDGGESRMREIKWGVDIKLLKTYLMMKNNWSDADVESHLNKNWDNYVEDTRYQELSELSDRVANGESVGGVILDVLKRRVGKEQVTDVRQELLGIFGQEADTNIQALITSSSDTEFSANMRSLMDKQYGPKLSYQQATEIATNEYKKLLETPLSPNI